GHDACRDAERLTHGRTVSRLWVARGCDPALVSDVAPCPLLKPPGSPDGRSGIPGWVRGETVKGVRLMKALKNFVAREDGQDLIEYALLAALLSIVSIAALQLLGPKIALVWTNITNAL